MDVKKLPRSDRRGGSSERDVMEWSVRTRVRAVEEADRDLLRALVELGGVVESSERKMRRGSWWALQRRRARGDAG